MWITLIFIGLIGYLIYTTNQKYQETKNKAEGQPLIKNGAHSIPLESIKSINNSQQPGRL
jgi:hypothetical protein